VTVAINHVSLEEDADAMNNPSIRQLFVEYKFLGIDPQETETPFSLPKPKPYHNIQFNFSKSKLCCICFFFIIHVCNGTLLIMVIDN
jgi:hypothetical protein